MLNISVVCKVNVLLYFAIPVPYIFRNIPCYFLNRLHEFEGYERETGLQWWPSILLPQRSCALPRCGGIFCMHKLMCFVLLMRLDTGICGFITTTTSVGSANTTPWCSATLCKPSGIRHCRNSISLWVHVLVVHLLRPYSTLNDVFHCYSCSLT